MRGKAGLEVHHLIEQRFAETLGVNPSNIPSIVLTREEHRVFTNRWRQAIGYNNMNSPLITSRATRALIWEKAQEVYYDRPDLLEAIRRFLGY